MGQIVLWIENLGGALQDRLLAINLITAFLLAGALLANRWFERRVAASVRVLLFAAVFLRVLLPVHWSSPLGLMGIDAGVETDTTALASASSLRGRPAAGPVPMALPASSTILPGRLSLGIGLVYLCGVALLVIRWARARRWLTRQLRAAHPAPAESGLLPLASPVPAPLLQHPSLGPLVAGLFRPVIVLPAALLRQADAEVLAFLIEHEAAHVRRRDHLLVAALQLGVIVAWPVLPLWLAARQMRGLIELACDEQVMAGRPGEQRRRYGELLLALSVGEVSLRPSPITPAFGWQLRTRVRALRRPRRWRPATQLLLVAGLACGLFACSGAPETAPASTSAPVLRMNAAGGLTLDGRAIERIALEDELRAALHAAGTEHLSYREPPAMTSMLGAGDFLLVDLKRRDVLQVARRAGAKHISVLTDSASTETAPAPTWAPGSDDSAQHSFTGLFKSHVNEIKRCYEARLKQAPELQRAHLELAVTINAAGKAARVAITGPPEDKLLNQCLIETIRTWEFPRPKNGQSAEIRFPLVLQGKAN